MGLGFTLGLRGLGFRVEGWGVVLVLVFRV